MKTATEEMSLQTTAENRQCETVSWVVQRSSGLWKSSSSILA